MTKNKSLLFFIIASLTSCNYISYSQLVPMIRTATFGVPDVIIDDVYISAKEYSFAKVKIDNEASIKMFEACGFTQKYYILTKN